MGGVRVRVRVRVKEGGRNGGRKDCIEGKEGWEGSREGKNNNESNIITLCKCVIMKMVCCYSMCKQKQHVSHLFTIKINFKKNLYFLI